MEQQTIEKMNGVQLTKVCQRCGKELPINRFARNAKSADGHLGICKDCHAESITQGRAKKKEQLALPIKGVEGGNPDLAQFTPRQLMDELRSRGFEGTLTYVYHIKI